MLHSADRTAGARAAFGCVLGTFTPALLKLATSDWFGVGDLRGLVVFTMPLLVILVVSGIALARAMVGKPLWSGALIGGAAGLVADFLWTVVIAAFLGPWMGAWSVPVLLCWTLGGALGLAAAVTSGPIVSARRLAIEAVLYSLVAAGALYAYRPAIALLNSDQHLTLVYGRVRAAGTEPAVHDPMGLLVPGEKELLARAALGGLVEIVGGHASNTTEHPRARAQPANEPHRARSAHEHRAAAERTDTHAEGKAREGRRLVETLRRPSARATRALRSPARPARPC